MLRHILFWSLTSILIFKPIYSNNIKNTKITIQENRRQQRAPTLKPPVALGYKRKKDDGYYEPYWEKGDWVFYRKSSTNKPQGFFLNTKSTQHVECNQICLGIYSDYGIVCGMRINKDRWTHKYEFETFDNMCYLELANCVSDTKHWVPIKKGNCTEGLTTYATDPTKIATRKLMWEQRFPAG